MQVEVLDAVRDSAAWAEILDRLPPHARDVYFQPAYVRLHEFIPGTRSLLFAYTESRSIWAYAFLLQPITHIGPHKVTPACSDIESPYGYGGPLTNSQTPAFLARAQQAFDAWCQSNNVVAEFVRLHPLLENERWLSPRAEVVFDRETVSLALADGGISLSCLSAKARNMVRRAKRQGITVREASSDIEFARFRDLYCQAMGKLDADEYYYFNPMYFDSLRKLVQETGWLLTAEHGGELLAAAVFLRGVAWAHYHLAASDVEKRSPGANNALIYAAAELASRSGMERLHLGGGRTAAPDDPLLGFKRTMATDTHPFTIGKRVHDGDIYAGLCELWEREYPSLVPRYGHRLLCYRYGM